jgi:hypothetical protein
VTPRATSSLIQRANGSLHGTSANTGVVQAGGTYDGPSNVRSSITAICARVTGLFGQ